jgi:N-methylhydantoinase A/oxoprolinase/acetone carboxylase beta subunit
VWGPALESEYSKLEVRAAVDAGVEEIGDDQVVLERQLELRYALQGYDLSVRVDAISGDDALSRAEKDFHEMHQIVYGTSAPEEDVEIVNVRLVAIRQPAPPIDLSNAPPGKATTLHERHREVSVRTGWFAGGARPVDLAVHWRDSLISGQEIFGPAIIEQDDTTTVVYPDQRATVLSNGDLLVELDIDP